MTDRKTDSAPRPADDMEEQKNKRLLRRMWREYLAPYKGFLCLALVFMALEGVMTASVAQLMQPILDGVLNVNNNRETVWRVAGLVFATFFIRGITTYAHTVLMNKVGQSVVADIQQGLFGKFMRLDLAFFHANPSGQLVSRVINDVNVMRMAVSDSVTSLGKSSVTLICLIGVMLYQDWKLSLVAFIIIPFAATFVVMLGKKLRRVSGSIQDEMASLTDMLTQIFQGVRQVKAYGMETYEQQRAGKAIERVKNLNMKSVRTGNLSTPVNEILIGSVLFCIIGYGGTQVGAGAMTAGQLGAFLAAFIMAYEPMKRLAQLNNKIQMGIGASERIFRLMDKDVLIKNADNAPALDARNPDIVFRDVVFQYDETDAKALNGVSFRAENGKVLALVGPSGSGKSTIMNLIPRFYDTQSGSVAIAGQDIRDISVESLRCHIALVSQDITIFDDTVSNNIRYSKPDATQQEVEAAAHMAYAHDFIMAMPAGYDTMLGEDGVRLSGGQRQRISIARAILRDAPVLLLDEATSALDNESEQAIQMALRKLEKGRTTIVIAHRLSTVQDADKILVLDKGAIVEEGRHDDLMARRGLYAKMYNAGL